MSTYLYNTITKASMAYGGLFTFISLGVYNYGYRALIYPFIFSSIFDKSNFVDKRYTCDSQELYQNSHDTKFMEDIKKEIIELNKDFRNLKDTKFKKYACFNNAETLLNGEIKVGYDLIQLAQYDKKNLGILKAIMAHELGHVLEWHCYTILPNKILAKLSGAAIYNFLTPYTQLNVLKDAQMAIMNGAATQKSVDLTVFIMSNVIANAFAAPQKSVDLTVFILSNVIANAFAAYILRQLEYRADNAAVKSGLGKDLIKFFIEQKSKYNIKNSYVESGLGKDLIKFFIEQKSKYNIKNSYYDSFFTTHPSIENRIFNIIKQEELLTSNGSTKGIVKAIFASAIHFGLEQCFEIDGCAKEFKIFGDDKNLNIIEYGAEYSA
jgi:hypothetical protein